MARRATAPPASGAPAREGRADEDTEPTTTSRERREAEIANRLMPVFFQFVDRSTGPSNKDLVDHLKASGSVRDETIEAAFRAVDRGRFLPGAEGNSAYDDSPVRFGHFHMSQPSLYADALEQLDLRPGVSFLNVGSGTGYLSSIVSEIVGVALHHGVDVHQDVLEHAQEMFKVQGKKHIQVFCLNANDIDIRMSPRYQRIYVGACVGMSSKKLMTLLEVGGILVGPFEMSSGQQIRRVVRKSENEFEVTNLKPVSFGHLIPSDGSKEKFALPCPPWSPESDSKTAFSSAFRSALREVLLCTTHAESPLHILPRELLVKHVFGYVHPKWFEAAGDEEAIREIMQDGEDSDEDTISQRNLEEFMRLRMMRTLAALRHQEGDDEFLRLLGLLNMTSGAQRRTTAGPAAAQRGGGYDSAAAAPEAANNDEASSAESSAQMQVEGAAFERSERSRRRSRQSSSDGGEDTNSEDDVEMASVGGSEHNEDEDAER
eukprot:TRINITY_DN11388_c0_g1_i1.p1 TRINITY_DN11388_c0_g1~~TRINITY_DN11388_c0_g1_i1.p1  ORF type:complete len:525 (+),score=122.51 TRINITY_DN11388_c0_g1_i1:111-1577(+)